jgi:transposase
MTESLCTSRPAHRRCNVFIGHLHSRCRRVEDLERHIALFDARIDELLTPSRDAIARLITIPGVSTVSAQVILAEIGTDMTRFPTRTKVAASIADQTTGIRRLSVATFKFSQCRLRPVVRPARAGGARL